MGETSEHGMFSHLLSYLYGKYDQLKGLKALGNFSDQFGSHKIPILLGEGPKPNISRIPGYFNPWSPVFMDINIPDYFKTYKKNMGMFSENISL